MANDHLANVYVFIGNEVISSFDDLKMSKKKTMKEEISYQRMIFNEVAKY